MAALASLALGQALTADQVLKKMADAYQACTSCEVTGVVTAVYKSRGEPGETVLKPYHLWFDRPTKWRFEFTEKEDDGNMFRFVAWTGSSGVRSWWTIDNKVSKEESIDMALAGATGISGGSAMTVPKLLDTQNVSGWSITEIQEPKLAAPERVGPYHCFKLEGYDFLGDPVTVWIDRDRFCLRKMLELSRLSVGDLDLFSNEPRAPRKNLVPDTFTTTTYETSLNKAIAPSVFEFVPPKSF